MSERTIRRYRDSDRAALSAICVETGDAGSDASGLFCQDSLLGDIWAIPYAVHDPELTFVVDRDGDAIGYVLGTADTEAFAPWFRDEWWPSVRDRYAGDEDAERDAGMLAHAASVGAAPSPYAAEYPAHLHIDLLPETQGGGFGRKLIERFVQELRERGVAGVHLVASAENRNAIAFYERLGFTRLASDAGSAAFGMDLRG